MGNVWIYAVNIKRTGSQILSNGIMSVCHHSLDFFTSIVLSLKVKDRKVVAPNM